MIDFIASSAIPLPHGLNKLDLAISLIITIPAIFGLRKGFLRSVFSLLGIIAGLILATRYTSELSEYFKFLKADERIVTIGTFILIMVAVYSILSYFAGKISDFNFMTKTIDRTAGLIFGAFKGAIYASLILIGLTKSFSLIGNETIESSKLYSLTIDLAPEVYNLFAAVIPGAQGFYDEFQNSVNSILK